MSERKITATDIIEYVKGGMMVSTSNFDIKVSEFCPYHANRRIDAFYLRVHDKTTKGYEIKVSRSDFLGDDKWDNYLKYCNYFYFVAPKGLIGKHELPDGVGLIEVFWREGWNEDTYHMQSEIAKKPKRLHDISDEDYIQLLEGVVLKLAYNRNLLK